MDLMSDDKWNNSLLMTFVLIVDMLYANASKFYRCANNEYRTVMEFLKRQNVFWTVKRYIGFHMRHAKKTLLKNEVQRHVMLFHPSVYFFTFPSTHIFKTEDKKLNLYHWIIIVYTSKGNSSSSTLKYYHKNIVMD